MYETPVPAVASRDIQAACPPSVCCVAAPDLKPPPEASAGGGSFGFSGFWEQFAVLKHVPSGGRDLRLTCTTGSPSGLAY